jgi:membrane dipeptidase
MRLSFFVTESFSSVSLDSEMRGESQLIIDGHLDMAFNALFYRRDLTQPVSVLREREVSFPNGEPRHPDSLRGRKGPEQHYYTPTVALPDMRRGRVGIMLSTIMARVQKPDVYSHNSVRTQSVAYARGRAHLAYYEALETAGEIRFIRDVARLDDCVRTWVEPRENTPVGLILTMESADPILGPDDVGWWWDAGLRSVCLTHFGANTYGHGTGTEGGLFPPAYPLMDALKETHIAIDLTHASDLTFWQILDYWDGPVHASHCNCRSLVPGQRHLSDDMIKAITERNGVIGIVFAEQMLNPALVFGDRSTWNMNATLAMKAVLPHIEQVCKIAGNSDCVAFGTDLDGGFGLEMSPTDYNTIDDLQNFLDVMRDGGFSEENIAKFAHGNLLRFFRNNWS